VRIVHVLISLLLLPIFIYPQSWRKLDSLCYEYGETKPDSAIILGKKAIEGCIREKGGNSIEYAVCLDHIAWAYKSKNRFKVADSLYKEAITVCKNTNKVETVEYTEIINNLALLYKAQGFYHDCEPLYVEAKTIIDKILGKKHSMYATLCNNLALLYKVQGRYIEAQHLYIEAKTIRGNILGKEHPDYAQSCNNLGFLYKEQGHYSEAEPLFIEAKNIYAKVFGKEHPNYASICNNLALLYQSQGRHNEAERLYEECKSIYFKIFGKEHSDYALLCNNLASLYKEQNRYQEAESLYIQAKNIRGKILGKMHPEYAQSCNNLASLYMEQERYKEAETLYLDSKDIRHKVFGKNHPLFAISCVNLASLYQIQNRYREAENLYTEAKDIFIRVIGKEYPMYTKSCNNLAELYKVQGKYIQAEPLYFETFTIKQKEIERNFKNLSEVEKEQYFKANIEDYNNDFLKFIWQYHIKSPSLSSYGYQIAISTKGLILNSTEKIKQRILKSNNQELKNLFLEWKTTRDKYNKTLNLTIEQRKEKKLNLDSLEKRANELEKQLALKSEDFAHVFTPKPVTWQDIQTKLKKDEAAIEVTRFKIKKDSVVYMAMILKKNSQYPEIVQLPNGNELETSYLTYYRRSITGKMQDEESYNAFWKPLKNALKDIKTVYFSSEGAYHQINLATLQNPETKKYIFDEVRIIPVTNTKDILDPAYIHKNKNTHLIGNPKYDLNLDIKGNEKPEQNRSIGNLSQLEGAEKEVKQASAFFQNPTIIIGENATEEQVKHLKNPRILHIATHGYFKKGQYQSSTQAMLNGGLLFAGVVDYDKMYIRSFDKDDGKLTAFEVMNMELDSTELVVLSACETGLGQANKDGVYGLQRAFKVAGAQAIIMSLWKVSDEATQLLMTEFYQNWQKKGMDKRKAFETAQKKVRKQYKEPYYWGAFVMIE
jgi:CHAT domain-containing protein